MDDKCIIQELPINNHHGTQEMAENSKGNRTSIKIEICEQEGIN